tara:strand:- start:8064 stop:8636 length:573 start_codon:yes stop_codon:yes gene_type:complete
MSTFTPPRAPRAPQKRKRQPETPGYTPNKVIISELDRLKGQLKVASGVIENIIEEIGGETELEDYIYILETNILTGDTRSRVEDTFRKNERAIEIALSRYSNLHRYYRVRRQKVDIVDKDSADKFRRVKLFLAVFKLWKEKKKSKAEKEAREAAFTLSGTFGKKLTLREVDFFYDKYRESQMKKYPRKMV